MNQRAFHRLLYRTLTVPVLLLAVLATVLLWEVQHLRRAMHWIDHTDQVISSSGQLLRLAVDAETGVRGYLVTGDERFLQPYYESSRTFHTRAAELSQQISDNPSQLDRLKQLEAASDDWNQYAASMIQIRRGGGNYADVVLNLRGKELMDSVRQHRDEFLSVEEHLREQRVHAGSVASRLVVFTSVVLSLGIGLFLAFFTRRQLASLAAQFQEAIEDAENRAKALAESEQRWATTLASIGDAVIATDVKGEVKFMNALAQKLSGWKLAEAAGKPSAEIFRVLHEETGETIENPVTLAIQQNKVVELANHALLLGRNGERTPVEDSAAPIINAQNEIIGAVLVFRDVTERRRRERERDQALANEQIARELAENAALKLSRVQAVTDAALAHVALDALLEQLLERSCEALQADMAVILLLEEQDRSLHVRAARGLDGELQARVRIPFGAGMAGKVASSGQGRIIDDLSTEEVCSPILKERVASLIAAPLVVEDRVIGVIHIDSSKARKFTEDEAKLLQVVADRVALAIDRAQREDVLQRVTRTLKALNNSNQALLRASDETQLLRSVCEIVTEDCGHPMVWIGYAENDEGKSVRPVAYSGFEQGYLDSLQITWAETERGNGPTGTAIRTGQPAMCADMLSDLKFAPWRAEALKRGFASSAVVPLLDETGKAFGAMTMYSKQTHAFSPDEFKLLSELAGDLSFGIRSLRARVAHAAAEAAGKKASEQRRLALEGAEMGAWEVRLDTGEVFWDERCRNRFGVFAGDTISYEEAIARIHDEDRGATDEAVQRAIAGVNGGAYHHEFRVVWPDGSVHWVASHGRAYFEGEGGARKAVRFIGVNMDITERKHAEDTLRESEQRWATTLSSIGDAVISTDAGGRIVFMNRVAEELTGWMMDAAAGQDLEAVFNIVSEVTRKKSESPVAKVIRMNQVVGLANHTLLIKRNGAEIPIDDSAAPIRDRSGNIEGVVLVFRDVSDRKKAEELLRNSERLAITGRMAASIAHEIHNPLDAVGNLLYMIQNDSDPTAAKKYAAMAGEELTRVVQMTKHMLAFNRETHKPAPVRVAEVMSTVMELYARKINMSGVSIEQRIEFTDEIQAFPSELRQILANLVGNAIEAVGNNGSIIVHAYASRDWTGDRSGLRVVVADNGHGIPREIRDKIFDPFYTTKGDSGTGLGLWITSGLVEKHEGVLRLWTSTRKGKSGTCFSVFLPFETHGQLKVKNKAASQS